MTKYPNIKVRLTKIDGNVFSILGTVQKALRKDRVPEEEIKEFRDEATSGDYDKAIQTCMNWITVS